MLAKLLMLSLVVAFAGVENASAQPGRVQYDPNDPEKTRPVVPVAERERLGLAAKTWDGVVQPEVYTTLHGLNQTVERLKNAKTVDAVGTLAAVQFEGTVCVQVRLKHDPQGKGDSKENKAALRDVQRRVLGSLTAVEFHVRQLFEESAGFVGNVSREGLDKLGKHPDVQGVCLDDQPLPERAPAAYKSQFGDPKPAEFEEEPGLKAGRVQVEVYHAFKQSNRVYVLASLEPKREPLPTLTDVPSQMQQRWLERDAAVRQLRERVLSTLTADEFWLWTDLGGAPGFAGYVNREGIEKLWRHPEVTGIGLNELRHPLRTERPTLPARRQP